MTQLFALPAALAAGSYTPSKNTVPVTRQRRSSRRGAHTHSLDLGGWPDAFDQCLRAGLAQGRLGIREATDRVLAQHPAITRAQCWRRLRWLREHAPHSCPDTDGWPPELLACLRDGYRDGGARKRAAFRAVRAHYTDLPGHVIVRMARRHGWLPPSKPSVPTSRRRWTADEQRRFSSMAEHRGVAYMARVLGRSPRAIRWRLAAQGLSAKVGDAWSLHALERTLHVSHNTLQRWIAEHDLRVRDAHITGASLRDCVAWALRECADQPLPVVHPERSYRWKDAAALLGHRGAVREALANGMLKLADATVSDRALETFFRRHGVQRLNCMRIDPAIHRWLMREYRLPATEAAAAPDRHGHDQRKKRHGRGRPAVPRIVDEPLAHSEAEMLDTSPTG